MFILDTNVVSELRKRNRANRAVIEWATSIDTALFYISSVVVFEIRLGALLIDRRDPVQGALMLKWIEKDIISRFEGRIFPVDTEVAKRAAELHVPNPRQDRDAFIAATALVHDMTVVTRNERDFAGTGVRVMNPWPPG